MFLSKGNSFRGVTLIAFVLTLIGLMVPASVVSAESVQVLCDGETYDGYAKSPFKLDGGVAADASIQKVIRNCTFKNSKVPGVILRNAVNVLIENNTFNNIRTNEPGKGVHAVNAACSTKCADITVHGNSFKSIGADGIQIGDSGRNVTNFVIEDNTFIGAAGVGENAVDVKGADGPIIIRGNLVQGFRPCLSPKKGGNQDCSGSPGEGIVLHEGSRAGAPGNITVEGNTFDNNVFGISVSRTLPNVVLRNNTFKNNQKVGALISNAADIRIESSAFTSNPKHITVKGTGTCALIDNTFSDGTPLIQSNSNC